MRQLRIGFGSDMLDPNQIIPCSVTLFQKRAAENQGIRHSFFLHPEKGMWPLRAAMANKVSFLNHAIGPNIE